MMMKKITIRFFKKREKKKGSISVIISKAILMDPKKPKNCVNNNEISKIPSFVRDSCVSYISNATNDPTYEGEDNSFTKDNSKDKY